MRDREAKNIMLKQWPKRTNQWNRGSRNGYWIRCSPKEGPGPAGPQLATSTNGLIARPDGLWIYFLGLNNVDAIAIEVCGSEQNLYDKRSRYAVVGTSLILKVSRQWLRSKTSVQNNGQKPWYRMAGTIDEDDIHSSKNKEYQIPVRSLRTLFVLPEPVYSKWLKSCTPNGHEFFMKQDSFRSATSQKAQNFLKRMSVQAHFYTTK